MKNEYRGLTADKQLMLSLADGQGRALLLHVQADRVAGHGVLRPSEEGPSNLDASRLSSRSNAVLLLDWSPIRAERPWDVPGRDQRLYSHNHVRVLHAHLDWPAHEQIPLVEEVYNGAAAVPIRPSLHPHRSTLLQWMQLPVAVGVPAPGERAVVHLHVRLVLRGELHQAGEKEEEDVRCGGQNGMSPARNRRRNSFSRSLDRLRYEEANSTSVRHIVL